jgi:type IV pilus assembly protein PilV
MKSATQGFTLVEVLVALIVISIGLLGIAKLQALALSSTATAGKRSIAALEAAGMASAMHADRGYWDSAAVANTFNLSGTSFTTGDGSLAPGPACLIGSACSQAQMAAYDLVQWASSLSSTLGTTYTGTITCTPPGTGAPPTPASCQITLKWIENVVATDATQAAAAQANIASNTPPAIQTPTYTLFVTP